MYGYASSGAMVPGVPGPGTATAPVGPFSPYGQAVTSPLFDFTPSRAYGGLPRSTGPWNEPGGYYGGNPYTTPPPGGAYDARETTYGLVPYSPGSGTSPFGNTDYSGNVSNPNPSVPPVEPIGGPYDPNTPNLPPIGPPQTPSPEAPWDDSIGAGNDPTKNPDDIPREPLPPNNPGDGAVDPNPFDSVVIDDGDDRDPYYDPRFTNPRDPGEGSPYPMTALRQWFIDNGYGDPGGPIIRGNGQIYTTIGTWRADDNGMPTGDPFNLVAQRNGY